jgi:CheY-like chemotaxis protein
MQVVLAANGREAVKAHSKQNLDAIFMDVHMPVLDGIRATHIIRRGGMPSNYLFSNSSVRFNCAEKRDLISQFKAHHGF